MQTVAELCNIVDEVRRILGFAFENESDSKADPLEIVKAITETARTEFMRQIQADVSVPYWIWSKWSKTEAGRFVQDIFLDARHRVEQLRAIQLADFTADRLTNGSLAETVLAELAETQEERDSFMNQAAQKEMAMSR